MEFDVLCIMFFGFIVIGCRYIVLIFMLFWICCLLIGYLVVEVDIVVSVVVIVIVVWMNEEFNMDIFCYLFDYFDDM